MRRLRAQCLPAELALEAGLGAQVIGLNVHSSLLIGPADGTADWPNATRPTTRFHVQLCTLGAAAERPAAAEAAPPALPLLTELALEADALPYSILSRLRRLLHMRWFVGMTNLYLYNNRE